MTSRISWRGSRVALALVAACTFALPRPARADGGQTNFNKYCAACHTIGGGKRVGPDLAGLKDRHPEEWLVSWIADSQKMVNAGDAKAVALFKEYNVAMPPTPLSADEIRALITFIESGATAGGEAAPEEAATPAQIKLGEQLFRGSVRFANGGPACSSCHHVTQDAVIGGGILAKELTAAHKTLGGPGIRAILGAPPFPVMQQAFAKKPLTDEEMTALVGYLADASTKPQSYDQPRQDSLKLLFGGLGGFSVLMIAFALIWNRRKQEPVAKKIFDRQAKSH